MNSETIYSWWNLLPFRIDPTLITIGGSDFFCFGSSPDNSGFPVRYYGLMYLVAFYTATKAMQWLIKKDKLSLTFAQLEGITGWTIAGVLIGARLGYALFYNFEYYMDNLGEIFLPFKNGKFVGLSGMSYHGGLIGGISFTLYYLKKHKINPWMISNLFFVAIPLGYTWGRIGNFLNGELWGRQTTAWIGMVFPGDKEKLLRHPSQLYEALLEGVGLFGVLLFLRRYEAFKNHMAAFYLIGYGIARFIVEYFRQPDAHIGLNPLGLSRGQILCGIMILAGAMLYTYRRREELKQ
jgi:phosphatidylglycerol:prolipoprotein diacylglycerol transferase